MQRFVLQEWRKLMNSLQGSISSKNDGALISTYSKSRVIQISSQKTFRIQLLNLPITSVAILSKKAAYRQKQGHVRTRRYHKHQNLVNVVLAKTY